MAKLYILCGPSGSGKTTWAMNFIKQSPDEIYYVSRDEIRFSMLKEDDDYFAHEGEVFKLFSAAVAQALITGHDVIADATHLNAFSRKKLINAIDEDIDEYSIIYIVFNTPYNKCVENNRKREGLAYVPQESIVNMFRTFKKPTTKEDERIINIIEIDANKEKDYTYMEEPYWWRRNQDE